MKIAVLASPVTPLLPAQLGGAQSVLTDLAVGLAARGHDVRLYCAEGSRVPGLTLVTVPVPADAAKALVKPFGSVGHAAPGVDAAIAAMFQAIATDRPDVVSQHAFDAAAFRANHGVPILHTIHLPPLVPAVVEAVRRTRPQVRATVSGSCAAQWRDLGVAIDRVLSNGVPDLDTGPPRRDGSALVAGRISPEKGIAHAVEAARQVGLGVRIAGAAYDPDYAPDLDGADWLGSLDRAELRRVMASSAVTICAARWDEPFGMVAAEAQMAGCPVAAYARGGLPEVIEDGVSGRLAAPDDVDDLARAIRECLELDRTQVRASALRRLGLDAAIDRYEHALSEVAA